MLHALIGDDELYDDVAILFEKEIIGTKSFERDTLTFSDFGTSICFDSSGSLTLDKYDFFIN